MGRNGPNGYDDIRAGRAAGMDIIHSDSFASSAAIRYTSMED
jgi:hypothetical protein